jgi:cobalamin biosynthesis Co2+ chelatase CbiK
MVTSVAEWSTLLELCEDLLHRLVDYEILCIYDLDSVVNKLKEKWRVSLQSKPKLIEKLKDKT